MSHRAGPKPEWAKDNSLVKVRTCAICNEQWWEHDHSVSALISHLNDRHPGWDKELNDYNREPSDTQA